MVRRSSSGSPTQWNATLSPRPCGDVTVDAVHRGVERAADEPLGERQLPLERACPSACPIGGARPRPPTSRRDRRGFVVDPRLGVRLSRELGGRIEVTSSRAAVQKVRRRRPARPSRSSFLRSGPPVPGQSGLSASRTRQARRRRSPRSAGPLRRRCRHGRSRGTRTRSGTGQACATRRRWRLRCTRRRRRAGARTLTSHGVHELRYDRERRPSDDDVGKGDRPFRCVEPDLPQDDSHDWPRPIRVRARAPSSSRSGRCPPPPCRCRRCPRRSFRGRRAS